MSSTIHIDSSVRDRDGWRSAISTLASFERPSASEGERRAAQWLAERLRERRCDVELEQEQAHGGYWWPIGLANSAAAAAAMLAVRRKRGGARAAAAVIGAVSAAALWDDLGHGRRWFRRTLLPRRPTWNVVAETGDCTAQRTLAFVAHHDAAHSGLVFHPALGRIGPRVAPRQHERSSHTFPILYTVWLGPVTISAGAVLGVSRLMRAGIVLALAASAAMADIGARSVVPGANDNLSAVGVLLALAERLSQRPVEGLRVLLISTGSEESFSEGMQGWLERHRAELDPATTEFVCLECLGGEALIVLEGEGMLRMRDYPASMRDALAQAAVAAGVPIKRGVRTVAATDAIIALRAGYRVVTLASIEPTKLPRNYHWPSDVPEDLCWETIEAAISTCERFVRLRGTQND